MLLPVSTTVFKVELQACVNLPSIVFENTLYSILHVAYIILSIFTILVKPFMISSSNLLSIYVSGTVLSTLPVCTYSILGEL